MARNNVRLINYHTSGTTAPQITDMAVGEIAVGKDLIWSKHKENEELSVFISSGAVHSAITVAETTLEGITDGLSSRIAANTKMFEKYATSANTVAADEKVLSSAKTYTDTLKGSGYTNETLAGLKSEINSLKGGSDTTVGAVASRVTEIEGILGKTNNEGLRKDVADLKTTVGDSTTGLVKDVADLKTKDTDLNKKIDAVSGASSAYTDSQIDAIKGDGYTGGTLVSIKSEIGVEKKRIDAILKDAPTGLTSFKDVETKITNAITAAYKYQGSVENYNDLPDSGKTIGYVYNVVQAVGTLGSADYTPAGTNYAWNGTKWDALGGTVDLSTYATKTDVNDALTGVTGTGKDSIVTRLRTAETNIDNLKLSASTLNTDVQTIKGWKINNKFISGSPILNGMDIKVDNTEGAQTLKVAIAAAKNAGDSAMDYAKGVSGSVKSLTETVGNNKTTIDGYTVNGLKISEKPVLTGENVKVSTATTAQTLNKAIDDAKAAGTTAQDNLNTLKGSYTGTLETLSNKVNTNEQSITNINGKLDTASSRANSAIQRITIKANADAGVTISDPTGGDGAKTQELDFSAIVIDCGEF